MPSATATFSRRVDERHPPLAFYSLRRGNGRAALPFAAERLAFSDGSVIFSANMCASGARPASPTSEDVCNAEKLAATKEVDDFEERHPTLTGDW